VCQALENDRGVCLGRWRSEMVNVRRKSSLWALSTRRSGPALLPAVAAAAVPSLLVFGRAALAIPVGVCGCATPGAAECRGWHNASDGAGGAS